MVKVLLIEQETLYQKTFKKLLEKIYNCSLVGIAETGIDAMKLIHKHHPQVIFSEILLGNENGLDICRAIKDSFPEISVNVLTSYRNINLVDKAIQAGINQYVLKPVSEDRLKELCVTDEMTMVEDEYLRELISAIEEKDYMRSYQASSRYILHIFRDMDSSMRKTILKETYSKLISLIPGMDQTQKKYYMQKYKMTAKVLSKDVLSYCWIQQIVTEVFRQLCVMKYSQMNKVLQYIENNINNDISLSEIASSAEVSSGYLSRIFKKYYRMSVVDYIHLRKILLAKKYMVSTDMNISDISFLLGYSEAGYFSKIFKKYEKITPSTYVSNYS